MVWVVIEIDGKRSKRWELNNGEKSDIQHESLPLTPPKFNRIAPEKRLLKDDPFLLVPSEISVANRGTRGKWVGLVHRIVENIMSCWWPTWKIASWGPGGSRKQMLTTVQTPSPLSKLHSLEKTWIHQSSRERFHHHHQHHKRYMIIPVHKAGNFLQENRVSHKRSEPVKTWFMSPT